MFLVTNFFMLINLNLDPEKLFESGQGCSIFMFLSALSAVPVRYNPGISVITWAPCQASPPAPWLWPPSP